MEEEFVSEKDYNEIVRNVIGIIEDFGYTELKDIKSPKSDSIYFIFCDDEELTNEEVNLIVCLRVSDHKLSSWGSDRTKQDAKNRQLKTLQQFADENRFLNKHISDNEHIPIYYIYVKYENEFYTELEDLYSQIRKKLQEFTNKNK